MNTFTFYLYGVTFLDFYDVASSSPETKKKGLYHNYIALTMNVVVAWQSGESTSHFYEQSVYSKSSCLS